MALSMEDQLAIQQLYARYNHAIDFGDAEGWANTFTEDGTFKSGGGDPAQGREALQGFARGYAERMKGRHWTNNLVIEGDAETAKGKCYLILFNLAQQPASPLVTAVYEDELVKQGGEWRFRSRAVKADA